MAKGNNGGKGKGQVVAAVSGGEVTPLVRQGERVFAADKRDGVRIGLTHGLLLTGWYNGVFDRLAAGQVTAAEYSDEAIAAAVRAEYPGRGSYQSTQAYRSYYNGQRHGLGAPGYRVPSPPRRKAVPATPATPAAPALPAAK